MKKVLLSLIVTMLCGINAMAQVAKVSFPMTDQESVSAYQCDWTGKDNNGNVWRFINFNNNKNGWSFIKCGWKTDVTTSVISSPLIAEKVSNYVLTVDKTSGVTSAKLEVLKADSTTIVETKDVTMAAGSVVVELTGTENAYYRLTIENEKVSSNGTTQISGISLTQGEAPKPVDISNTIETAYTTAEAISLIDAGEGLSTKVYVKGTISKIDGFNETYGSITYWLDDDAFQIYSGLNNNGEKFASVDDIKVGSEVVVYGNIKKYNTTYEMDKNNWLVSYKETTTSINAVNAATSAKNGKFLQNGRLVIRSNGKTFTAAGALLK